jgi:hypothetical protein
LFFRRSRSHDVRSFAMTTPKKKPLPAGAIVKRDPPKPRQTKPASPDAVWLTANQVLARYGRSHMWL